MAFTLHPKILMFLLSLFSVSFYSCSNGEVLGNINPAFSIDGGWEQTGLPLMEKKLLILYDDHTWTCGQMQFNGQDRITDWSVEKGTWLNKGVEIDFNLNTESLSYKYETDGNNLTLYGASLFYGKYAKIDIVHAIKEIGRLNSEKMLLGAWEYYSMEDNASTLLIFKNDHTWQHGVITFNEQAEIENRSISKGNWELKEDKLRLIHENGTKVYSIKVNEENLTMSDESGLTTLSHINFDRAEDLLFGYQKNGDEHKEEDGTEKSGEYFNLRIASWNLGHLALGASHHTAIPYNRYEEMQLQWSEAVNSIDADIFCCCEYSDDFIAQDGNHTSVNSRDAIFSPYHYAYIGTRPYSSSYMQTAIFSRFPLENVKEQKYRHTVQSGRYFQYGDLILDGRTIKVVSTHLDFNQGANGHAYRIEQVMELIDYFKDDSLVILCGDWNMNPPDDYALFTEAGYEMANCGSHGVFFTWPSGINSSYAIDNIICKGFSITSVNILNDERLSDHNAIFTDLSLRLQ